MAIRSWRAGQWHQAGDGMMHVHDEPRLKQQKRAEGSNWGDKADVQCGCVSGRQKLGIRRVRASEKDRDSG